METSTSFSTVVNCANSSGSSLKIASDTSKDILVHRASNSNSKSTDTDSSQADRQMQAYHQSFNPQAYISNTNGAAAAVAAAAYYGHHNPANYVIPPQYSITDGFGYAAGNPTAAVAAAALAGGSPQNYNAQQVDKKRIRNFEESIFQPEFKEIIV